MSTPPANNTIANIAAGSIEALVSKGIYAMLFPLKKGSGGIIVADTTTNILNGYPVGGFTGSGDTADNEEFQDQLLGGNYKTKVGGAIDPGDLSFNTYFAPSKGKPEIVGVENSMVITPQFVLILARRKDDTNLQGFFACGVNYKGGMELKGDYGKVIGSSLKFELTGEPKYGYTAVGDFALSLYGAIPYETAVNDILRQIQRNVDAERARAEFNV